MDNKVTSLGKTVFNTIQRNFEDVALYLKNKNRRVRCNQLSRLRKGLLEAHPMLVWTKRKHLS